MEANRNHKDTLFSLVFSDTSVLISLYNALSGSNYGAGTPVALQTLDSSVYLGIHNDLAFSIDDRIVVLVEQQSTVNENMPLRMLLYLGRVLEKIVDTEAIYHQTLVKIPKPEFFVLYNGTDKHPPHKTLSISTAYKSGNDDCPDCHNRALGAGSALELDVDVYNINSGYNEALLSRCAELYGYSDLVGRIRDYKHQGNDTTAAVTLAIRECIKRGNALSALLKAKSSEVLNMLTTEFNMDTALRVRYGEGRREGVLKGMIAGKREGLLAGQFEKARSTAKKMLSRGFPIDQIAELTDLPHETIRALADEAQ
ncbi:hypothetical protein FACS1894133_7050 [Clostridia bacterium]|nr:hypothetical protein FACS1894133_7050 [Clostridia bacterium]